MPVVFSAARRLASLTSPGGVASGGGELTGFAALVKRMSPLLDSVSLVKPANALMPRTSINCAVTDKVAAHSAPQVGVSTLLTFGF